MLFTCAVRRRAVGWKKDVVVVVVVAVVTGAESVVRLRGVEIGLPIGEMIGELSESGERGERGGEEVSDGVLTRLFWFDRFSNEIG